VLFRSQGPQFHAEAGAHARAAGIPLLFALGAQSVHAATAYGGARHFNDMSALLVAVRDALSTVGSVLVKGSRFMKMEQVVEAIAATAAAAAQPQEQQQKQNRALEGHHGATL
jgi:UDP-N-acetylmuramoyl-tripeptide--D-alanyl-D-alanine ligase